MNKVKRYVVNLNDPPEIRWNHIIDEYKEFYPEVLKEIDNILKSLGNFVKMSIYATIKLYKKLGYIMYKKELESISERSNVSFDKLLLMQLCYEMSSACTSVGFLYEGRHLHFRTMDWAMPILKKLTIEVEFKRDNKTLFIAPTWAGYVGVVTGVSNKNYSIALNFRRSNGTLISNVKKTLTMVWPVGYFIRTAMENEYSVDKVLKLAETTKFISPCYITIVEPDKTTVLIRDDDKLVQKKVTETKLVQTNNDEISTVNILYSNERKSKAYKILESIKSLPNINTYEDMLKKFSVYPIINEETVYVSILDPNNGFVLTMV
jgi:N-acylethanolamine-hydrolysing acid amidase